MGVPGWDLCVVRTRTLTTCTPNPDHMHPGPCVQRAPQQPVNKKYVETLITKMGGTVFQSPVDKR